MEMFGPRERLFQNGVTALTEKELLGVLLRTGFIGTASLQLAAELIAIFGDLQSVVSAPAHRLLSIPGIGPAKAATLLAAAEIAQRLQKSKAPRGIVSRPESASSLFQRWAKEEQEVVAAAFLDVRNQVLDTKEIFRGSVEQASARPREILCEALRQNAVSIIVAHNHPSGVLEPSEEDIQFTTQLEWACRAVGITLLDHLITNREGGYFSFVEQELIGGDAIQPSQPGRSPWRKLVNQ